MLDFPGGAVVKTQHSRSRGHGFDPWLVKFHMLCGAEKKKKFYVEKKNQAINENISRSYNSSHEEDSHVHLDNI